MTAINMALEKVKKIQPQVKSKILLKLRKLSTKFSYLCGENNCGKLSPFDSWRLIDTRNELLQ